MLEFTAREESLNISAGGKYCIRFNCNMNIGCFVAPVNQSSCGWFAAWKQLKWILWFYFINLRHRALKWAVIRDGQYNYNFVCRRSSRKLAGDMDKMREASSMWGKQYVRREDCGVACKERTEYLCLWVVSQAKWYGLVWFNNEYECVMIVMARAKGT